MGRRLRSAFDFLNVEPGPTAIRWWDWALAVLLGAVGALEALAQPNSDMLPFLACELAVAALLPWRRRAPFAAVASAAQLLFIQSLVWRTDESGPPATSLTLLVLVYNLARWERPRRLAIGLPLALGLNIAAGLLSPNRLGVIESLVASVALLGFPSGFALAMRYRASLSTERVVQARLKERHDLARELHDVVAHHVSAIAVASQAAQAVAKTNPAAAVAALAMIESTASQTLTEMRRMVGSLRADDVYAPLAGTQRLAELAGGNGTAAVVLSGDVGAVDDGAMPASVRAAIYRIAQESITNARRHGREHNPVELVVRRTADSVELMVTNRGSSSTASGGGGFGIVGMTERAEALGGSLTAGPLPGDRWRVTATLPVPE